MKKIWGFPLCDSKRDDSPSYQNKVFILWGPWDGKDLCYQWDWSASMPNSTGGSSQNKTSRSSWLPQQDGHANIRMSWQDFQAPPFTTPFGDDRRWWHQPLRGLFRHRLYHCGRISMVSTWLAINYNNICSRYQTWLWRCRPITICQPWSGLGWSLADPKHPSDQTGIFSVKWGLDHCLTNIHKIKLSRFPETEKLTRSGPEARVNTSLRWSNKSLPLPALPTQIPARDIKSYAWHKGQAGVDNVIHSCKTFSISYQRSGRLWHTQASPNTAMNKVIHLV